MIDSLIAWSKNVSVVFNVPRLGFMDNFFCAFEAFKPFRCTVRKTTGAFWGQCHERAWEDLISEGAQWIMTVDYDSLFKMEDVASLFALALRNPYADAIAPIQIHRITAFPLMTIRGPDGQNMKNIHRTMFTDDLLRVSTAHFGLTLIKTAAVKEMPKPWFWSKPDPSGSWHEGRQDDDIYFWRQFEAAGHKLYQANRVVIGHYEGLGLFPDENFEMIYQHPKDFYEKGKPENLWR